MTLDELIYKYEKFNLIADRHQLLQYLKELKSRKEDDERGETYNSGLAEGWKNGYNDGFIDGKAEIYTKLKEFLDMDN